MKWLNALGLLLQFLSFWFAAPELLGTSALQRFEEALRKFLAIIPLLILMMVVFGYGIGFSIMGITKGLQAAETGMEPSEMYGYMAVLLFGTIVYFIFMYYYKAIKKWLDLNIAKPLSEKLVHNNETRSTALAIGAVLFTIGFLLQFVLIFVE